MFRKLWRKTAPEEKIDLTAGPADKELDRKSILEIVSDAFTLSAHVLAGHGGQLTGQMVARLSGFDDPTLIKIIQRGIAGKKGPWLRPMGPSLPPPGEPLLRTLNGHSGWVRRVAISPDGKYVVSGSMDRSVKVWDLESGRELRSFELFTQEAYLESSLTIDSVGVTPVGARILGGERIVTRVKKDTRFWDLARGQEAASPAGLTLIRLKSDGTRALLKQGGGYQIWDLVRNQLLLTLPGEGVEQVLLNPLWTHALLKTNGAYQVLDFDAHQVLATMEGAFFKDTAYAITPYGLLIARERGKSIEIWDLQRFRKRRTLGGHTGKIVDHRVTALAITPDGTRVISCSYDATLKVWDMQRARELFTLEGSDGSVAVTPDGTYLLNWSLSSDTIKIWELEGGAEVQTLTGHAGGVSACAIHPDGTRFVSAGYDGTLKIWDLTKLAREHDKDNRAGGIRGLAVTPDGKHALAGNKNGAIQIWDLDTRASRFSLQCQEDLMSVAVTPDGTRVAAGLWESVEVWNLKTRQRLMADRWGEYGLAPQDFTGKLAITPDSKNLLACCRSAIHRWDLTAGKKMAILGWHEARVNDLVVIPPGDRLVSASSDAVIKIWDLARGEAIREFNWYGSITAVTTTPDGAHLITGGGSPDRSDGRGDYVIRVVQLDSGQPVMTLAGHTDEITALAVTPDGTRLVSSADDRTVRVWSLQSGAEIARFIGEGSMEACAVALDGSRILAGDAEGWLHFLQLENL